MKIIKFGQFYKAKKSVMLGFFDCLHIGHRALLSAAKTLPYETAVFTFSDGRGAKSRRENVYTFAERLDIFEKAGLNCCIYADFDAKFKNLAPSDFLDILVDTQNISAVISGYDYKFGKGAAADTVFLENYCKKRSIAFIKSEKIEFKGEKASSTLVKEFLAKGDIVSVNALLGDFYRISGIVKEGRAVGRKILFPTANIDYASNKAKIADGVYGGFSYIDNVKYSALINCGAKPTFNVDKKDIEVHFLGFEGDLYGRELTVFFKKKLRDIVKFNSADELKSQIEKDIREIDD